MNVKAHRNIALQNVSLLPNKKREKKCFQDSRLIILVPSIQLINSCLIHELSPTQLYFVVYTFRLQGPRQA